MMMNEKLGKAIIYYTAISWGFALILLAWNYLIVPLAKSSILTDIYLMQQLSSLNISSFGNNPNQIMQVLQLYTPIPTNQLIKDELALILPPAILGLIYYSSKKENHDE
jgi:hypothetical protein